MRYRKLSSNNDYVFGGSQLDFYRDEPAAVGQSVMTRLLLFLGEWYLDVTTGTPWIEGILGKHSLPQADSTIQNQTLETTDGYGTKTVTGITDYTSTLNGETRGANVAMAVNTIYGPTEVQIENYATF